MKAFFENVACSIVVRIRQVFVAWVYDQGLLVTGRTLLGSVVLDRARV